MKIQMISRNIRVKLTDQQLEKCIKSANVARWAYNYFLSINFEQYNKPDRRYFNAMDVAKIIVHEEKPNKPWLKEVSHQVIVQALRDADDAFNRCFKKTANKPKFKKKFKAKQSFYLRHNTFRKVEKGFRAEHLGIVETCKPLPELISGKYYSQPRLFFNGKYWILHVSFPTIVHETNTTTGESLGIDLGTRKLATCSNGMVIENINHSRRMKLLEKRKHRQNKSFGRKRRANTKGYKANGGPIYKRSLSDCKNFQKQKAKINNTSKKMTNIRHNHLHQTTTMIVKTKPSRVVMENLNIKGMLKNKHLSKHIRDAYWFEFRHQIQYKCELNNIEFVLAYRWFPSSQICSCCGNRIKLKTRKVYQCDVCGMKMDRDLNASINLANYQV